MRFAKYEIELAKLIMQIGVCRDDGRMSHRLNRLNAIWIQEESSVKSSKCNLNSGSVRI